MGSANKLDRGDYSLSEYLIAQRQQAVLDSPITKMREQFTLVKGQIEKFIESCPDTRSKQYRLFENDKGYNKSLLITPIFDFRDDDGLRKHTAFAFKTVAVPALTVFGKTIVKPSVKFSFNSTCEVTSLENGGFSDYFESTALLFPSSRFKCVKSSDDIVKAFSKFVPLRG